MDGATNSGSGHHEREAQCRKHMLCVRFANGLRMLSEDSDQTRFVISRRFVHRAYIIINNNLISKNK